MARSHVRRLRIEDVRRELWKADGLAPGLVIRVLNLDEETGGRTLIVDVPPRWEQPAHHHTCDEELLVLDGELRSGAASHPAGHYCFRPAGTAHSAVSSPGGARLLYWHDGSFDLRPGEPPAGAGGARPLIDGLDTRVGAEDWDVLPVALPRDVAMIRMRSFELTGADNTLEWLPDGFQSHAREFHTADEEILILDGWAATDARHVYVAGEYLFWKAGTVHGPTEAWNCKAVVKHYGKHETVHVPLDLRLRDAVPEPGA